MALSERSQTIITTIVAGAGLAVLVAMGTAGLATRDIAIQNRQECQTIEAEIRRLNMQFDRIVGFTLEHDKLPAHREADMRMKALEERIAEMKALKVEVRPTNSNGRRPAMRHQ